MNEQVDHPAVSDLLCTRCGYDLTGSDPTGRCPECASRVELSLSGDALVAADPDWLRRVRNGLWLVWVGCLLLLLRLPVLVLSVVIFGDITGLPRFLDVWYVGTGTLALAFVLVGVFGATALDPRLSVLEKSISLRIVTRTTAGAALGIIVVMLPLTMSDVPAWFSNLVSVPEIAVTALLTATAVTLTLYLSGLALRLPNVVLSAKLRRLARQAAVVFALAIVLAMLAPASPTAVLDGTWLGALSIVRTLTSAVAVVYVVLVMIHWWRFRRLFSKLMAGTETNVPDPLPET